MKVRFSLPSSLAGLIYFFFTELLAGFFAELLAGSLAVCGAGVGALGCTKRPNNCQFPATA
jgi:hypothetical protein